MARFPIPVWLAFMFAALLAAGCERAAPAPARGTGDAEARAAEAWTGVWPCADCDGIETWLELSGQRDEGRYRLVETYLGTGREDRFIREGDWRAATLPDPEGGPAIRLDPEGLDLWFARRPDGALERRAADGRPLDDADAFLLLPH